MRLTQIFIHLCLVLCVILFLFPLSLVFIASMHASPHVLVQSFSFFHLLKNSFVMAFFIALGKTVFSFLSAYALVYFRFPFRKMAFVLIFITLMLPLEVRIAPTFQVVINLHLLNSMTGLTLPLFASAIGTFLFYQFFLSIPDRLFDMAKMDGVGPLGFLWHIVLPLSKTHIAMLFMLMFIYGWNQYLWPLVATHQAKMGTLVVAMQKFSVMTNQAPEWNLLMTAAMLALVPSAWLVIVMHRLFLKG